MKQIFERIAEAFNKGYGDVSFVDSLIMIATILIIAVLISLIIFVCYKIWEEISYIHWCISKKRQMIKENKEKESKDDSNES